MRHPGKTWIVFAICAALGAAALARVTMMALRLAEAEADARRRAGHEEAVQLALWRMDSILAPLVAEEGARPFFHYSPFYPAERAYTQALCAYDAGEVLVASPLLAGPPRLVRLHFQYGPDGVLASPQAPAGASGDLATARYVTAAQVDEAGRRLDELARLVRPAELAGAMDSALCNFVCPTDEPIVIAESAPATPASPMPGAGAGAKEFAMRSKSAENAMAVKGPTFGPSPATRRVSQGPLRAFWLGPTLLLARRVQVADEAYIQGCWLDWDSIRAELRSNIADLLPGADLEPVRAGSDPSGVRRLAALPIRLVDGPPGGGRLDGGGSLGISLAIAWGGLLAATLALALVLRAALALSERRGTFVSAVTHELRTPLTTFRIYTEMLDEGMVADEPARRAYLATLRTEADRLGHLVENVLAFARLERGRAIERRDVVTAGELLDRLVPPLAERARQGGMELVVSVADSTGQVLTDVSVVGQILANLIDNACKYATASSDRRIELHATRSGGQLALFVRDHGPGISKRAARRLFRPFSRSAGEAAGSAPGVGLGLALSRRLARALGGDLSLVPTGAGGACFALRLPLGITAG